MAKIKARLAKLLARLTSNEARLKKARKRYAANRKLAKENHARQIKFQKDADLAAGKAKGGYANSANAQAFTEAANRCAHRAYKAHLRAQYWLGEIKASKRKIDGLEQRQDKIEAELTQWQKEHGVTIEGNKVVGGTPKQRWQAACLASVANCASGKRRNFYSMSGAWDVDHVIVPGESYGERSDCSSTVTGWAKAAGLPDPNGEDWHGGYTGTLIGQHNGWKLVSYTALLKKGWGYVVYGSGVGHHVEAHIGPGNRTAGHGSSPVDFGVDDLFGEGESSFRCYCFEG